MDKKGCNIFEPQEFSSLTAGLKMVQCMMSDKNTPLDPDVLSPEVTKQLEDLTVADAHSCSCCLVKFANPSAQRAHFKLDWHRYNIKRQLSGLSPVPEDTFTTLADAGDDIESISGSESESEEDVEMKGQVLSRHVKMFFKNHDGHVVSLYRCLLCTGKDYPESELLVKKTLELPKNDKWAVIMLGGGHFAAAIFKGQEPIVHKTFHCYTVRAKQGGAQSTRDSKGGGHPKSAGASLRRYNEMSLIQHVQDLISSWADHFNSCNIIFYRAVGPTNRAVLFGGRSPPLDKCDARLRTIPFVTRRATFNEVKRVHGMLSFLQNHGPESEFELNYLLLTNKLDSEVDMEGSPRRGKTKEVNKPNRAKSRPSPQRPLPASLSCTSSVSEGGSLGSLTWEDVEIKVGENVENFDILVKNDIKQKKGKSKQNKSEFSTESLKTEKKEGKTSGQEIKSDESEKKKKAAEKKARKKAAAELRKQLEEEEKVSPLSIFQKTLLSALESGDIQNLQTCLSTNFLSTISLESPGGLEEVINLPVAEGNNTALHIASRSAKPLMVSELLAAGADPTAWNKKCKTPYGVAANKEVKVVFEKFRQEHPEKFDYEKSQIPLPATEEELRQEEERKAAARKARKEKEKAKQKLKAEMKAEEEEKARFKALSDREKRALAAERRILAARTRGTVQENPCLVLARCFTCGCDISGITAFEYNNNRFCTIECLKAHRMQNPGNSSRDPLES